jgi:DNA segregation ATPase FtsK/SpoIIIE-like protein
MEPSFASQLHSHAPAADHFPYAQRGPASQPDLSVDETSDIARRFAPARREGEVPKSDVNASDQPLHAWPDHRAGADDFRSTDDDHGGDAFPPRREASPHGQLEWPPSTRPRHHEPALEELYGRAVAIVLRDRKVSSDHLRGCMKIGYMCASDIIERMEKEGVVGAPLYNGLRPILIGGSGSGEI